MVGIINSAMQAPSTPASMPASTGTNISHELLAKTKSEIESKINPKLKNMLIRIETAGIALITHGQMPQAMLHKIESAGDDVSEVVSDGVANIIAMVFNHTEHTISESHKKHFVTAFVSAAPVASIAIMCQVLDMADAAIKIPITTDLIAKCSQLTAGKVLAKLHIKPEQVEKLVSAGKKAKGK